jgi:hypothetical protein
VSHKCHTLGGNGGWWQDTGFRRGKISDSLTGNPNQRAEVAKWGHSRRFSFF